MKRIRHWIWFALVVAWMAVIFLFSSQNAEQSSAISGGITEQVIRLFYPEFDRCLWTQQEEILARMTFLVRKTAHFTEYGVLGFLLSGWLSNVPASSKLRRLGREKSAWMIGTVYAVGDEIHQMFGDGRAARLFDVCVDSIGTAAGILAFLLVCRIGTCCAGWRRTRK